MQTSRSRRRGFYGIGVFGLALTCALLAAVLTAPVVAAQSEGPAWRVPGTRAGVGEAVWSSDAPTRGSAQWSNETPTISEPARAQWEDSGWDEPATTSGNASGNATGNTADSATGNETGGTHVVQAGETLVSIAQHYGLTPPQLVRVNSLGQPPAVYPGQTLTLPGGSSDWGTAQPSADARPAATEWDTWETPARGAQAAPAYNISAPDAPSNVGKTILISTAQQYLWAYADGKLVLQTPVTTGRPGADTPVGTYPVLVKYSPYRFVSPFPVGHEFHYEPVDSNYSLRITWEGHHIHDAPWRTDFGPGTNLPHNNSRGQMATGSIGCVNVPTSAMAQLYEWADEGIQVTVQ
ncbi:MAG: L,D-transpeptidase family protein [Litorilinea sp.]